jgi:tRNA(His) 5'-end guanylyltransferase
VNGLRIITNKDFGVNLKKQPSWQKGVLIFHLAAVAGLFVYEVEASDFAQGFKEGWNGK